MWQFCCGSSASDVPLLYRPFAGGADAAVDFRGAEALQAGQAVTLRFDATTRPCRPALFLDTLFR